MMTAPPPARRLPARTLALATALAILALGLMPLRSQAEIGDCMATAAYCGATTRP